MKLFTFLMLRGLIVLIGLVLRVVLLALLTVLFVAARTLFKIILFALLLGYPLYHVARIL